MKEAISRALDRWVRPEVGLANRVWPAYRLAVYLGAITGAVSSAILAAQVGLLPDVALGTAACGIVLALSFGMVTKIVTGGERYTVYHYQLLVLAGSIVCLIAWDRPVLPYLDLIAIALAVTQAFGRVGCLMAGCCHGRPHAWGVRYGSRHVAAGFPRWLANVRLLPVQAFEALGLSIIAGLGMFLVLAGGGAGQALAWYLTAYALLRFGLEVLRGDTHRPRLGNLSEAQWIALFSLIGVVGVEWVGLLPLQPWHTVAMAGAVAAALLLASRRPAAGDLFSEPRHLQELAEALEGACGRSGVRTLFSLARSESSGLHVATTALGLRLSAGRVEEVGRSMHHYTYSRPAEPLTPGAAATVARYILTLRHPGGRGEVVAGRDGIFHLLVGASLPEVTAP